MLGRGLFNAKRLRAALHLARSLQATRTLYASSLLRAKEPVDKEFGILHDFFDSSSLSAELRPKDRPGRSWSVEELRLKSNVDLHKLWYVLLKERNMLLTMRGLREERGLYFCNPERVDRVEESMQNLESVVHERNDAVLRLETGDGASPPMRTVTSFLGFTYQKPAEEHLEPFEVTKTKEYEVPYLDDDAYITQKLWNEKQHMKARIAEHDEHLHHERTPSHQKFKKGVRKSFDRLEQLPTRRAVHAR